MAAEEAKDAARPLVLKNLAPHGDQTALKEVGLKVLATLVKHIRPTTRAVERVGALLAKMPHSALFSDWSPPACGSEVAVTIPADQVTAESKRNSTTFAPKNALSSGKKVGTTPTFWSSVQSREKSWWQATLPGTPAPLSSLSFSSSASHLSETVRVNVRPTETAPWRCLGYLPGSALSRVVRISLDSEPVQAVRIELAGFAKTNTDKAHTVLGVEFKRPRDAALSTPAAAVLGGVERWLLTAAASDTVSGRVCQEAAFGALMKFALATGALSSVLRVAQACMAIGSVPLSPAFADKGGNFLAAIKDQYFEVCNRGGSPGGGTTLRTDVVFDEGAHSSGIVISDGGKTVRCTSGNAHAMLNIGFKTGRAAWEMKLVQDSVNGECSTMGLAIKPTTNSNYEHSPTLWCYRAYNGYLYAQGRNLNTPLSKYHPNDIVRFELDMDAGTCTIGVNGSPQRPAWTGLKGKEVFPAVAFYSSNRTIRLMKFEAASTGGNINYLSRHEAASSTSTNGLWFSGNLPSGRPASLGGEELPFSVGMKPRAGHFAEQSFSIDNPDTDTFRATVGLDDSIGDEAKLDGHVQFSVWGDGDVQLWSSPQINKAKDLHKIDLHVAGMKQLTLKVKCTGPNALAKAVWGNAHTMVAPWWWDYKQLEKDGSPIVKATESAPESFVDLGDRMLLLLQLYASEALRTMRTRKPPAAGDTAMDLELPFTLQVSPETLAIVEALLNDLVPKARSGDGHALHMALSLLKILKANLRCLAVSGVEPRDAGIHVGTESEAGSGSSESKGADTEEESKGERTLGGLHEMLSGLAGKPGEVPEGVPVLLSVEAGEVLDVGVELFFPSPAEREAHIRDLLDAGCVVEAHFKWPAQMDGDGGEDHRFERAALLLQSYCRRKAWKCATNGQYGRSIHVVVEVPPESVVVLLKDGLADIMTTAGFDGWAFPTGCVHPEIKIKIERTLSFDRKERCKTEAGAGWVRVYPRGVGGFDGVTAEVDGYVAREQAEMDAAAAELQRKKEEAAAAAEAKAKEAKDKAASS